LKKRSGREKPSTRWIYRGLSGLVRLLARIPFPVSQSLGRGMGGLFACIPLKRPRVAVENLLASFGPALSRPEAERLYRRLMGHFGAMLFELPHIFTMTERSLSRYVTFDHPERMEQALAKGKGCFILTAHFGNWELMSAAACLRYAPNAAVVARPMDFPPVERLFIDLRTRFGTEVIPKDHGMRRIIRVLRENRPIGILLDQNVDWYAGVFVPFMGRPACTNKGLALMALKTGAPVVPIYALRQPDGRYRVVFEEEVRLSVTGDKTRDVEENTRIFTEIIESWVSRHPEQWFWFHRRWKTRPFCPLPGAGAPPAEGAPPDSCAAAPGGCSGKGPPGAAPVRVSAVDAAMVRMDGATVPTPFSIGGPA